MRRQQKFTRKLPKIKIDAQIFDFELTSEEMEQIAAMNENLRFGPDPDNFNF